MITRIIVCDICGAGIGMGGGAHIDLGAHNVAKVIYASNPPQDPGAVDLCGECRDALVAWLKERKERSHERAGNRSSAY